MSFHNRLPELLGRLSLRAQLGLGFACLSLFGLISAVVIIVELSKIEASTTRELVIDNEIRALVIDLSIDVGVWRQYEHEMLLSMDDGGSDGGSFAQSRKKWDAFYDHFLEGIDELQDAERSSAGSVESSMQWRDVITSYHESVLLVLGRVEVGEWSSPIEANRALEKYSSPILALIEHSHQQGEEELMRAQDTKARMDQSVVLMLRSIWVFGIGSILFAVALSVGLSRLLTHRGKRLCQEVGQLAKGDFTSRVSMDGRDEFATIGRAINAMALRIEERNAELQRDIARRELVEANLTNAQQRYELAVRGSRDGLWDWDLLEDEIYYAPRWKAMLGFNDDEIQSIPEEWIGRIVSEDLGAFQSMIAEHLEGVSDEFESEFRMVHKDGSIRWMLCRGAAVRNKAGRVTRLAGSLADITEIKETQEALRNAAQHDQLTKLPNRVLFCERLQGAIHRHQRDSSQGYAVLFFDFDRFKVVNDSLGHNIGDKLLVSIAGRFENELRVGDMAARVGGDEFIVLLTGLNDVSRAHDIGEHLVKAFEQPHLIDGRLITSTASVGLVTSEGGYDVAEDVIRDADAAMYQAKIKGKCQVVVFDKAMHRKAVDRQELEEDLRRCVSNNQLLLYYQPIVNLENGCLMGFEALVRWMHPTRGLIGPIKFIPIAEDTGLIVDIGLWVLRQACLQVMEWNALLRSDQPLVINVNMSKRQLCQPDVIDTFREVFDATKVDPSLVKIEITESVIVDNRLDMIPILEKIKTLGVQLAMDDFGTGQSSLSGLHKFPIDVLKIDQSFVQHMEESRDLSAVVYSIITLAHNLGMEIVAEGIETADQLAILQSHGCEYGQGYYFSKPLPAQKALEYAQRAMTGLCRPRAA